VTVATSTQLQATRTHAVNVIEFDSFYVIIWTIQSLNKLRLIVATVNITDVDDLCFIFTADAVL